LISTAIELGIGTTISVYVYLTDKRATAKVVHIDPKNPLCCGIELDKPRNIWGVSLPPDDWEIPLMTICLIFGTWQIIRRKNTE
jgi:hypothetical protein